MVYRVEVKGFFSEPSAKMFMVSEGVIWSCCSLSPKGVVSHGVHFQAMILFAVVWEARSKGWPACHGQLSYPPLYDWPVENMTERIPSPTLFHEHLGDPLVPYLLLNNRLYSGGCERANVLECKDVF